MVSRADLGASARTQPGIHDDATELAARAFEINAGPVLTISTVRGQGDRRESQFEALDEAARSD
jgi:hypothetical protein